MHYLVSYDKKSPHKTSVRSYEVKIDLVFDEEPTIQEVVERVRDHSGGDFIEGSVKFKPTPLGG